MCAPALEVSHLRLDVLLWVSLEYTPPSLFRFSVWDLSTEMPSSTEILPSKFSLLMSPSKAFLACYNAFDFWYLFWFLGISPLPKLPIDFQSLLCLVCSLAYCYMAYLCIYCLFLWDWVLLYSPGWPWRHYVAQASPAHCDSPASACQGLALKLGTVTGSLFVFVLNSQSDNFIWNRMYLKLILTHVCFACHNVLLPFHTS